MQGNKNDIIFFLVTTTGIIFLLAALTITLFFMYQKRQRSYKKQMDSVKSDHEKSLIMAKLEMKESTFKEISREIHDNISLSLTLAKLHLNTFDWKNQERASNQVSSSIDILGDAIEDLRNISRSLNSDVIASQGLIKAIENEIDRIRNTRVFSINYHVTGIPTFMDNQKELITFRIIQEVFNNIIKHALAKYVSLRLHYTTKELQISISDNGRGFLMPATDVSEDSNDGAGLKNIAARIEMIGGRMNMKSFSSVGTAFTFIIPFNHEQQT